MGVQFAPPHSGNPSYSKALSCGYLVASASQSVDSGIAINLNSYVKCLKFLRVMGDEYCLGGSIAFIIINRVP